MMVEVKSSQRAYQKTIKQLFDGIERLEEIFACLGMTTQWQYVGVFCAISDTDDLLFDCDDCNIFAIIGEDKIPPNFERIEEKVAAKNPNWKPEEHVHEFVELVKQILFIAQGDPYAPVTGSGIIDKIVQHLECASSAENIFFWTLDQLSIVQAVDLLFLFLDAFYSTGKTIILKYYAKEKLKNGETVHYFNQRPIEMENKSTLLPFTLMLQKDFPPNVVKETTFQFGIDSVKGFLQHHGVQENHHVVFDEVICSQYSKSFLDSIIAMKNCVASLWIAMGSQPIRGKKIRIKYI